MGRRRERQEKDGRVAKAHHVHAMRCSAKVPRTRHTGQLARSNSGVASGPYLFCVALVLYGARHGATTFDVCFNVAHARLGGALLIVDDRTARVRRARGGRRNKCRRARPQGRAPPILRRLRRPAVVVVYRGLHFRTPAPLPSADPRLATYARRSGVGAIIGGLLFLAWIIYVQMTWRDWSEGTRRSLMLVVPEEYYSEEL